MVSTDTMDYIDAATSGTLSPHMLLIMDLQKMLIHIEETLPPMPNYHFHQIIPYIFIDTYTHMF